MFFVTKFGKSQNNNFKSDALSYNFCSVLGNKTVRGKQNRRYNLRVATWRIGARHPKAAELSSPISAFFPSCRCLCACVAVCCASERRRQILCRQRTALRTATLRGYLSSDAPKHRIAIARKNYSPLDCYSSLFEGAFTLQVESFILYGR